MAVYYVRTDGNNANTGLANSSGAAWLTIDFAASQAAAGDTVRVQAGTYSEVVTPNQNGSSGSPITFIADGVVNVAGLTHSSNSYLRWIGFVFDDDFGSQRDRVIILGGTNTGLEFWNNTIKHGVDGIGMSALGDRAIKCIFIGNRFTNINVPDIGHGSGTSLFMFATHSIIAYNEIGPVDCDAFGYAGQYLRYLNNYLHDVSEASGGHSDFFQTDAHDLGNSFNLIEGNFQEGQGNLGDEHTGVWQNLTPGQVENVAGAVTENIWRGNVWHHMSGGTLGIAYGPIAQMTYSRIYNNTTPTANLNAGGSNYAINLDPDTDNNYVRNELFYDVWSAGVTSNIIVANVPGGSTFTADYNLAFWSGGSLSFGAQWTGQGHEVSNGDPEFVDYAGDDFTIGATSAARNAGGPLTTTSGSGTGSTFNVASGGGGFFRGSDASNLTQYGGALVPGDTITVGTDVVTVVSISGDAITVAETFTWANGEPVYWGADTTPDIGAYPYKAAGFDLSATYSVDGTEITVVPNDDDLVRFVVIYKDGIPVSVLNEGPFVDDPGAGDIEVRVYPRYASKTLWVLAVEGEGSPGSPDDGDEGSPGEGSPGDEDEGSPGDEEPPGSPDDGGGGGGGSGVAASIYSDIDLQDPGSYYGGFKEARVTRWGIAERTLSDPWTGAWSGSTFDYETSDYDRAQTIALRNEPWRYRRTRCVRMTNRPNRAALGVPYVVWVGPCIDAQPSGKLGFRYTLGDRVASSVISDNHQMPWRLIRDGFLDQLDEIAASLDLDQPEPIIYGHHLRVPDVDAPVGAGFEIVPPLLGKRTVLGTQYYVWLIAGHAVYDVPRIRLADDAGGSLELPEMIETPEGSDWLIPHHANHTGVFGTSYEDLLSMTFGVMRRYTLLYGVVGDGTTPPDLVAKGDVAMSVAVTGVETNGDATGTPLIDRFQQYEHWMINFVARRAEDSYMSGAWLTNPTYPDPFDGDRPVIDTDSFDECSEIALERFPGDGYQGSAVIGARAGDRRGAPDYIAIWNMSCGCRSGPTHVGAYRVVLLHPTEAIKAAAPLYTDATEIALNSFSTSFKWAELANLIPFRTDYEHISGQFKTNDVYPHDASIAAYGVAIPSDTRTYQFAPGITPSTHLAILEARVRASLIRVIGLETVVGPDDDEDSLGYRDVGDYIRYRHFASVGDTIGEIRLAQIVAHQVQVGPRVVRVAAMDCEDLIGFDEPDESGSPVGSP